MPQEMTENPLSQALAWSGTLQRLLQGNPDFDRWLQDACHTMITPERLEVWFEELAGEPPTHCVLEISHCKKVLRQLRERTFFLAICLLYTSDAADE